MDPIKVAVVGCGHLGTFHARAYKRIPGCVLAGVADIAKEKADALGAELGCPPYASYASLLGVVDAVSVATPTMTHETITREFLDHGVHVLVEKPIAPSVASGAAMLDAARRANRVLAVGHIERCNPAFIRARDLMREPRFIESHRLAPFVARSLDVDVILDLMIHDLDLILSLAASPVVAVDAIGVPVITQGADIANARVRFADGSVANLTASRVSRGRMRKIRVFEKNLYVSVDLAAKHVESVRLTGVPQGYSVPADAPAEVQMLASKGLLLQYGADEPDGDALETELSRFLAAVRGTSSPAVDGGAGLACLELAMRVREGVGESMRRLGGGAASP